MRATEGFALQALRSRAKSGRVEQLSVWTKARERGSTGVHGAVVQSRMTSSCYRFVTPSVQNESKTALAISKDSPGHLQASKSVVGGGMG